MNIDAFADKMADEMRGAIKDAFIAGFQYAQSLNLNDEDFVDLGLPSGTLWSKKFLGVTNVTPEGDFFPFVESQKYSLPTEEQFNELKDKCVIAYQKGRYNVIGPNGNSIQIKSNFYWHNVENRVIPYSTGATFWLLSSEPKNAFLNYHGNQPNVCCVSASACCLQFQVRLVKCKRMCQ